MASEVGCDVLAANQVVLISGPPMTGKYELFLRLLADAAEGVICITTKKPASQVVSDYRSTGSDLPEARFSVVDCLGGNRASDSIVDGSRVEYVNTPADLTQIGVKFTTLSSAIQEAPDCDEVIVGLHSISQLVMHADIEQVYKFLQVLTGQIRTARWVGITVVDEAVRESEEASVLVHHFDAIIQTRDEDGRREYRVRAAGSTTDWEPF